MSQPEKYLDLPLEDILGDRFGRYSKYIIQERALPDARDGLKPVQRRILYAMHHDGNTSDKPYRKSAKTVGNVIGNFHPHGDTSVYDAMVRMSQEWKVRNVLIQMHGNNGSVDGDPPAAMRYTEARLSPISSELLKDIDKHTVEFTPNFDDTLEEPVVLPAMFPNLLVNGSTGISAGYATEIPPHHLGEVIDGITLQIEDPDCTVDDLMTVIKGPDFPTGGIIQGVDGIKKAYESGKGKIIIRGKAEVEDLRGGKQQIVITEIPYEVNKANLVKRIDELRLDKKVDGIVEVRDETDRTGLRMVIELKKDADTKGVLNFLYKNTDLQISYNFNMVAIYNKTPKLMGLKQFISAYIEHQKEVFTNRSKDVLSITEFNENQYLTFFTKQGMIKRTELVKYKAQRYSKPLMALKLKKEDELVDVHLTDGNEDLFIATLFGYGLWFTEEEVSVVGQRAAGVKGINLKDGDFVVSGQVKQLEEIVRLMLVTHRGAIKKMSLD